MDMGVDGESRHAKRLSHDHARGLVAHTGKLFQRIEISRHFTIMQIKEHFAESVNGFGFLG